METDPLIIWGVALLGVAFALVLLEAVLPSAGLVALAAGGCAVAGVVCLWMVGWVWGVSGLLAVLVLGPTAFFGALNLLPATPIGQRLLGGPSDEEIEQRELAEREAANARAALVGTEGVALTDLRPAGVVQVDQRRYDALAETGAIDRGQPVRVTGATMHELRVRPANHTA